MLFFLRNMCSGSERLLMIVIVFFMLMSFHCTQIASWYPEDFNVHGLQKIYYLEETNGLNNHIQKVSGVDEKEGKEALILEKFRALLGLERFKTRSNSNGDLEDWSPSPAPSPTIETPAPAPSPVLPIHVHPLHPFHRSHPILLPHKIDKKNRDEGRAARILVAVFVSAGATFVLCGIGFLCFCQRFRKQRKRFTGTVWIHCNGEANKLRSKCVNVQNSVKKVSSDPGQEPFYFDSLGTALHPQTSCLKQISDKCNKALNENTSCTIPEKDESEEEPSELESEIVSFSAAGKILSEHDTAESVNDEPDGCNSSSREKIAPEEVNSSGDESFHSFCNSHSSNVRLSNASADSLSDTSEICSPEVSKASPFNLQIPSPSPTPTLNSQVIQVSSPPKFSSQVICTTENTTTKRQNASTSPPPPPPPPPPLPPPPPVHVSPSHSCTSTQNSSKVLKSSLLPNLASPRNSDSSSGSNQTPQSDFPTSPCNVPKPPQGIPLPPCPPPLLKGNTNSLKGPPPPPSQLPQYIPVGKNGAPLPKLKPLHWDKVRAAPNCSTVWDKLKSSSFELDEEMIESLFGYNLQNAFKNDEAKSKTPSPSKHVLEPKRLQNITILAKALNVTAEQVFDALIQGDGLYLQQLEALAKMAPTKEEQAKLAHYKGDINELGSAEKFVKKMLEIPYAFPRIEAMLYKETFEDEVLHLRKSLLMLEEACKELRSSRLFLKLLEAVLKTGNRMNVGTIRGGARAFKLDALLKLADVKGTDGKTTLLHFVVQEIVRSEGIRVSDSIIGRINQRSKSRNAEEREEDYRRMGMDLVSGLSTELCNVKRTATIDLDVLASSVSNLSDGMTKLKHLVNKDMSSEENSGSFVHSMKSFLNYAEKNLKEVQEDEHRVLSHVREIAEYFHGDVSKDESNPLRIFVIVRDFLCMLDHVCKELRSLKVPCSPNPLAPFR